MNNSGVQVGEAMQNQQMMNAALAAQQRGFGALSPNGMSGAGYGMNPNAMPNMMGGMNPNMMPGMNPNMVPQAGMNWNMMPPAGVNTDVMPQAGAGQNMAMGTMPMIGSQAEAFNGPIMSTESEAGEEADADNLEELRAQRNMEAAQVAGNKEQGGYKAEGVAEAENAKIAAEAEEAKNLEKLSVAKELLAANPGTNEEEPSKAYVEICCKGIDEYCKDPNMLCTFMGIVHEDYRKRGPRGGQDGGRK